ncbi:MAG: long-chain fatty acid--CoA ligase [Rhodothermia bacterium]|nr:long-chain fatty acid--CoA ligase [Rhodothermia bacterium]
MPAIVDFQTIPQLFRRLVDHYAGQGRAALTYKDRNSKEWVDISWKDLERRVNEMAGFLHKRGVRKGDRVAILSENRPEWAITDFATQILGAVNVSLYTSLPADQVEYIIKDSGSKVFLVSTNIQLKKALSCFDACEELEYIVTMTERKDDHPPYVVQWEDAMEEGASHWAEEQGRLRPVGDEVVPADLAALIYTSGTTGNPKGVMLTHGNFCSNVLGALAMIPFGPGDHHLSFLPLCHSFEHTGGFLAVLACGARITYAESIDAVNKNLSEVQPTVLISVPRLFEKIYNLIFKSVSEGPGYKQKIFDWAVRSGSMAAERFKAGKKLSPVLKMRIATAHKLVFAPLHEKLGGRVRFAVSGGAALPKAIGEFFEAAGVTIIEGYGLTETSPVVSINPVAKPRFGTVGHVIPGVTVAIQSLQDQSIIGQLSGDDYPSDLTTDPGEIIIKGPNIMKGYWNNEAATKEAVDSDGWYHSGDVGRFENGYLRITDRIKHMIVSKGGKNIYPGPIEDRFKSVAWIDQIMVVGEGREFLTALVVPDVDAIRVYARENNMEHSTTEGLLYDERVQKLFNKEFRDYSRGAAAHEKIRDFRLILEPFTVENGMMTPTMKPKRRIIESEYSGLIEDMYAEVV